MAQIQIATNGVGHYRIPGACKGAHYQTKHTTDVGKNFDHDGNHWLTNATADISTTTRSNGVKFSGKNGKQHHTHVAIGNDSGCYPPGCCTGFKFKAYWEGNGRQIYLKRFGYSLRRVNNSTQWIVQVGNDISQGSTGDRDLSCEFSSDTKNKLNSGDWVWNELHLQFSTDNCCGDRSSTAYIYGFQFKFYPNGGSGKKLILPQPTSFSDRAKYRIA